MNTCSFALDAALLDLAAWCRLAHEMLNPDPEQAESPRMRVLKQELQRVHRRSLLQLRRWTGEGEIRTDQATHRPKAWNEVEAALNAPDDRVALAACALLQRAVLAAYDRAADRAWSSPEALQTIRNQKQELTTVYNTYSRKHVTAPAAISTLREAVALPGTGALTQSFAS